MPATRTRSANAGRCWQLSKLSPAVSPCGGAFSFSVSKAGVCHRFRGARHADGHHNWAGPMPSNPLGVPNLADRISEALYTRIAMGEIDRLDAVFSQWRPGHGIHIERRRLFPLDMSGFPRSNDVNGPLLNLPSETLLIELVADYVHAQLCNTVLHAFAAENEARMEAMASARSQIERKLSALLATQRIARQEEITAEIIELAAGETAGRSDRAHDGPRPAARSGAS